MVAFGLECIEDERDAVLGRGHQLPHTVLVGRVLSGPPGSAQGTVQLCDEPTAGRCW